MEKEVQVAAGAVLSDLNESLRKVASSTKIRSPSEDVV